MKQLNPFLKQCSAPTEARQKNILNLKWLQLHLG